MHTRFAAAPGGNDATPPVVGGNDATPPFTVRELTKQEYDQLGRTWSASPSPDDALTPEHIALRKQRELPLPVKTGGEPAFVLDEAKQIVYGAREGQYGHPSKNFQDIADGWSIIMGQPVTVGQVGLMMVWLKTMRANQKLSPDNPAIDREHVHDSFVDIAGYAEATMRALFEEPGA